MNSARGNNRMGENRDLFKELGDIKGIFHARTGTIKDRNGKDLRKAEVIKTFFCIVCLFLQTF